MHKLSLPKNLFEKLAQYLETSLEDGKTTTLSDYWDNVGKLSKLSLDPTQNEVIFPEELFFDSGHTHFDGSFMNFHGFFSMKNTFLEVKRRILKAIFALKNSQEYQFSKSFGAVWDQVDAAPIKSDFFLQNLQEATWESVKAANYLNELSPIIRLLDQPSTYLEIGAGGCHLIRYLKKEFPQLKFVIVDLPSTIPFGLVNLSQRFPNSEFTLPHEIEKGTSNSIEITSDFTFLTPDQIHFLPDSHFDIACNTDSFGEMVPETIQVYFSLLRRVLKENNVFFCNNRASKSMSVVGHDFNKAEILYSNPQVRKGEIHIRFCEYPWDPQDQDYFYYSSRFYYFVENVQHTFFTRATQLKKA